MKVIELSNKIDNAINSMSEQDWSIVNNVQGGYMSVGEALEKISTEHVELVKDAGELWSIISEFNDVESEAFNDWLDDNIDDEDLADILS